MKATDGYGSHSDFATSHIGERTCGLTLLKVIVCEAYVDTNATILRIREQLNSLDMHIVKLGYNSEKFNSKVKTYQRGLQQEEPLLQTYSVTFSKRTKRYLTPNLSIISSTRKQSTTMEKSWCRHSTDKCKGRNIKQPQQRSQANEGAQQNEAEPTLQLSQALAHLAEAESDEE
jgi:hypothetical protein